MISSYTQTISHKIMHRAILKIYMTKVVLIMTAQFSPLELDSGIELGLKTEF